MKAFSLFPKAAQKLHRSHHHAGRVKWARNGETITDTSYEMTERELKFHDQRQALTDIQRFSS